MRKIDAYTDGSCLGNPGVYGSATVMVCNGEKRRCARAHPVKNGTNNQAELAGVYDSFVWINEHQKESCDITFYTDSEYLCKIFRHDLSWLTASERPNRDMILQIIAEQMKGGHVVRFVKVKAHSGNPYNEEADRLARAMAIKARHELFGGRK